MPFDRLGNLIHVLETSGESVEVGVTFLLGGTQVSGILISRKTYFQMQRELGTQKAGELGKIILDAMFEDVEKPAVEDDDTVAIDEVFLKDVFIANGNQVVTLRSETQNIPIALRTSLIGGWFLGSRKFDNPQS